MSHDAHRSQPAQAEVDDAVDRDGAPGTGPGTPGPLSRREALLAGGVALAGGAAGCLGGGGAAPGAIALGGGKECDVCGMVIENHPGPNGQLFYAEESPEDHDNPAWFESLTSCFFPYYFEHDEMGWELEAGYVTDYSTVDEVVTESEGTQYLVSHTEAAAFGRADEMTYVAGTGLEGAMGPDFAPFGDRGDAESFADEHGGDLLSFDEVTPEDVEG